MVLMQELTVKPAVINPSTPDTLFKGLINYTVIVASQESHELLSYNPTLENIGLAMPCAFFVGEAKSKAANLVDHIPQAIGEMSACLGKLKRDALHGALTNGREWVFLIIELNANNDGGATYRSSSVFGQLREGAGEMWPDLVAGVLQYWVENSFKCMASDDNDWFEMRPPPSS